MIEFKQHKHGNRFSHTPHRTAPLRSIRAFKHSKHAIANWTRLCPNDTSYATKSKQPSTNNYAILAAHAFATTQHSFSNEFPNAQMSRVCPAGNSIVCHIRRARAFIPHSTQHNTNYTMCAGHIHIDDDDHDDNDDDSHIVRDNLICLLIQCVVSSTNAVPSDGGWTAEITASLLVYIFLCCD